MLIYPVDLLNIFSYLETWKKTDLLTSQCAEYCNLYPALQLLNYSCAHSLLSLTRWFNRNYHDVFDSSEVTFWTNYSNLHYNNPTICYQPVYSNIIVQLRVGRVRSRNTHTWSNVYIHRQGSPNHCLVEGLLLTKMRTKSEFPAL